MDKSPQEAIKAKSLDRTLTEVKADIARAGTTLEVINTEIANKKKELQKLQDELEQKRDTVVGFENAASDIINDKVKSVHKAITQRNSVDKSIKQLEKARTTLEVQIAEQRKEAEKTPRFDLVNQVIEQARETLQDLEREVSAQTDAKQRLEQSVATLEETKTDITKERAATDEYLKVLREEERQLTKKRDENRKALAYEQAKLKSIRTKEKDVNVLFARAQKAYGKTRNRPSRRSTI